MLIEADKSLLLVVDVQEKLIKAIHESQQLIDNCAWLVKLAQRLSIPVLASLQYPQGLGPLVPDLAGLVRSEEVAAKVEFSCVAANCFSGREVLEQRDHIIIAGIEAHVCVLQTALELLAIGKTVFLIADAVSSRSPQDVKLALKRMRHLGVQIVSKEMVLFEWLRQAGTQTFKEISKNFLQK